MNSTDEVMDFTGESPQEDEVVKSQIDGTSRLAAYYDAELASFFKRPVRIYSGVWSQAASFNALIDPWALFFADPRVINRITNYNLVRCNLCVKFVLSGNPFLYGKLIASYMPYPVELSNSTTTMDGRNPHGTGIATELVLATQRHYISLTPMESNGACMRLPFFNKVSWFQSQNASWVDFGKISIQTMNLLKHANGGTESVSLNIFAWAEDMELSVPTSSPAYGMVAQAGGDEYSGAISRPASVLAKAVSKLRNVPVIGPYAMATTVAAKTLAAGAGALGYCRPVQIGGPTKMSNNPLAEFAITDSDDTSEKLTVDPKQGVTIDTRVMGLSGEDEMGVLRIAQVESFLTTVTWPVGTATDTRLFAAPVTPMHYVHWGSTPSATTITPTAIAAASLPFTKWRGTIHFRFEVICTPYHKGRLRLLYDPYDQASLTKFNVNYTKIIDLAETREFEIAVSWTNSDQLRLVNSPDFTNTNNTFSTTAAFAPSSLYDNGVLTLVILNQLTAPQDTINNDIGINVYVRAGDDFELFEPTASGLTAVCMVPQSSYEDFETGDMSALSIGHPTDGSDLAKVVIGERVVSFRALLKRYAHYISESTAVASGTSANIASATYRNYPLSRGSDPINGLHFSVGLAKRVNIVTNCLLAYLGTMYAAYRGSIRYKHVYEQVGATTVPLNSSIVIRNTTPTATSLLALATLDVTQIATTALTTSASFAGTAAGAAVAFSNLKPVIEIEAPYYNGSRFATTRPLGLTNTTTGESHRYSVNVTRSTSAVVHSFIGIGEDFTFGYFIGSNLWYKDYMVA
jgi:hypothetical protein